MRKAVFLFFTVLVFLQLSYAQDTGVKNGVQLIDLHYADVTDVTYVADRDEIYSSDSSGKIICYDGTTQKYKFTFQKADGVAVHKMQLLNKNRLTLHKAYATMDGSRPDSLIAYDLPKQQKIHSQEFYGKFLGDDVDTYGAFGISKGYEHGLVVMKRDPFESVGTLSATKPVITASVNRDASKVAFVEAQYGTVAFVVKGIDNTELYREEFKDLTTQLSHFKVIYEDNGSVLLFISGTSEKEINIYRYGIDYKKELVKKLSGEAGFGKITESVLRNGSKEFFFGTNTNSYKNQYVHGTMKGGQFDIQIFDTNQNFSHAYFQKNSKEISFFSLAHSLSTYNEPVSRYRIVNGKKVTIDDIASFGDYRGAFLASGDLLFIGNAANEKEEIKLFTAGTLQNKFAPFSFREYIERNQDLIIYNHSFNDAQIDPLSSSIAVAADYKGNKRVLSYNLSTEKVKKLSPDFTDGFSNVVAFDGNTSQVVLSKLDYVSRQNDTATKGIKWCKAGTCKMIQGSFKHVKFSSDGNYLLSVNHQHLIELRELPSLKVIATKQIEGTPKVILNYSDNNKFEIALDYMYLEGSCYLKHITLVIQENTYDFQERDCLGVLDSDFQNGTQAALLNFVGVFVDNEVLETDKSVDPESISLNQDGSKLLVNYKHGMIELYDVRTKLKELSIVQPDYDSHLFIDNTGHYISNFKVDDLVIGYQDSKETSLNLLKSKYYKPSIILEKIGNVDADYAATLAKAEQIRAAYTASDVNSDAQITEFQLKPSNAKETKDLVNTFSFKTKQLDLKQVDVYLNGVKAQGAKISKKSTTNYSFELELAATENIIELRTASGTILGTTTITYNGTGLNPNLYVLAVGVSNYEQSNYNLTFASKDALDMAQLYGELTIEEIRDYQDEFYGKPVFLADLKGIIFGKKIKKYQQNIYGTILSPVSADGYLWLDRQNNISQLYNFKEGTILPIESILVDKEEFDFSGTPEFIIDPDNKGFYYVQNKQDRFFDFAKNKSDVVDLSFKNDEDLNFGERVVLLKNDTWLKFKARHFSRSDEFGDQITFTYARNNKVIKEQILEFNDGYGFSMVAYSLNGAFALIKSNDDLYSLYNLATDEPVLISQKQLDKNVHRDDMFISDDGSIIYRMKKHYFNEEKASVLFTYNDQLHLIEEKQVDFKLNEGIQEVVLTNQGPRFLSSGSSKATERQFSFVEKGIDEITAERSATAASFKKTHVTYLLDKEATRKNILKELKSLQKKVRPQDQVVMFIAGHGVLDEELNYYYAPNDMDFKNVTNNGVSFTEIIDGLNETSSTKMLLLMDTCHSGNTLDMKDYQIVEQSVEDNNGQKKRGGVAKSTSNKKTQTTVSEVVNTLFDNFRSVSGVTVISASSGQDVAYESDELSNGAFTTAYISYLKETLGQDFLNKADYTQPLNLSDDFIKELRKRILDYTNDKQQLDIREINELSKIKLW